MSAIKHLAGLADNGRGVLTIKMTEITAISVVI